MEINLREEHKPVSDLVDEMITNDPVFGKVFSRVRDYIFEEYFEIEGLPYAVSWDFASDLTLKISRMIYKESLAYVKECHATKRDTPILWETK